MNWQISSSFKRRSVTTLLFCLGLAGWLGKAEGEPPSQAPNGGLQFNLSTPGARSLAMGGAFIGLADDATAAYTNPAGLTNLTVGGPEMAVELRNWKYTDLSTTGGHIQGSVTNKGVDTIEGIEYAGSPSETSGLSFLSVGYILPHGFTVAVYRHEIANYQGNTENRGVFVGNYPACDLCRYPPALRQSSLSITNTGFSAAREIPLAWTSDPGDSLSIGVGISYFELDLSTLTRGYYYDLPFTSKVDREPGGFWGPPDYQEDRLGYVGQTHGSDDGFGGSLGLLWKEGDGHWSVGAVYRRGARFTTQDTVRLSDRQGLPLVLRSSKEGSLRLPDTYGAGVAYSTARGKTRLTLDFDRVLYSQRFDDRVPKDDQERSKFSLKDADEVHLGLEQNILTIDSRFVATLRLGAWSESAHNLEYHGTNPLTREFYPSGQRENHWTAGLGLVFGENFQIDAAADLSDPVDTVSISLVKFF